MDFKVIQKNMGDWVKKIKNHVQLDSKKDSEHCNNFATHCCLNCDKCWGKRFKTK